MNTLQTERREPEPINVTSERLGLKYNGKEIQVGSVNVQFDPDWLCSVTPRFEKATMEIAWDLAKTLHKLQLITTPARNFNGQDFLITINDKGYINYKTYNGSNPSPAVSGLLGKIFYDEKSKSISVKLTDNSIIGYLSNLTPNSADEGFERVAMSVGIAKDFFVNPPLIQLNQKLNNKGFAVYSERTGTDLANETFK